ncbi:MAG: ATP synthase F1 subunit delta [Sedimentisphaerales bacterium]|nr:ATP synthase F1 subunit delta [Sedimentisphaerales bacterium]
MAQASAESIARRYARALFELALERDQLEPLRQEIEDFAELFKQNDDLRGFLTNAGIHHRHKSDVVGRVFADRLSELVMNFLQVVIAKERAGLLLEMCQEYVELDDEHAGRVHGVLVTAVALGPEELEELSQRVGASIGKEVTLSNRVDATILGGSILIVGERVWDNSVRENLHRFSQHLRAAGEIKLSAS